MNVSVDVRVSAPLKYFMTAPPRIDFPDGVAIARMSAADKANLWRDSYLDSTFTKMEFAGTWFRLVWQYQAPRHQKSDTRDAGERFERVLSALRLAQAGHVEAPTLLAEIVPRKPPYGMSSHAKFRDTTSLAFFQGKQYQLDPRNIPALLQIYGDLAGLRSGGTARAFDLALRRYNQSFLRGESEDSIIDLAIALESTLLAGTKDELKYRLALRGATVLRKIVDAQDVYEFLSAFYNARSLIVHDGLRLQDMKASKLAGIAPHAFASKGQAIVRLVLLSVLQHLKTGGTLEELAKSIDDEVVSSLRHTSAPRKIEGVPHQETHHGTRA